MVRASDWDELLAEFRALGGTADNICLRDGVHGRGLFPVDPSKPVAIRIPEDLLIDTTDATFVNGAFRVAPGSGAGSREKAFLESYENAYSWGGGGRSDMERLFAQAQALPQEIRHRLGSEFHCGDWFGEATDAAMQARFIESRCIRYKGRAVVMPIVELINHGPGVPCSTVDGVALSGSFQGEVLYKYSDFDPQGMFSMWGFVAEQPQAFSIALGGKIGQNRAQVGRNLGGLSPTAQIWIPKSGVHEGTVQLQFLMIGNRQHPRSCKGVFYKIMRDAGVSGFEEGFDTIRHANRMHFLNLWAALEGVDGPMADSLRRMVRFQLQAMSYCYGVDDRV